MGSKNLLYKGTGALLLICGASCSYGEVTQIETQASTEQHNELNDGGILVRKFRSGEELLSANWLRNYRPVQIYKSWVQLGEYEAKVDWSILFGQVAIRRADNKSAVANFPLTVFVPSIPDRMVSERQENKSTFDLLGNPYAERLYAFYTFGSTHTGGGLQRMYISDLYGERIAELTIGTGSLASPKEFRFSPDYTTLSFITDDTEAVLNSDSNIWEREGDDRITFHVIDLLDQYRLVHCLLPYGDKRVSQEGERYWVPAWQFDEDGNIEFTLRRTKSNSYSALGNTELWLCDTRTESVSPAAPLLE